MVKVLFNWILVDSIRCPWIRGESKITTELLILVPSEKSALKLKQKANKNIRTMPGVGNIFSSRTILVLILHFRQFCTMRCRVGFELRISPDGSNRFAKLSHISSL